MTSDLSSYPDKLKAFGLTIVGPFKGAKAHHELQCGTCNHLWIATPISKVQSNKKYGGNGCPECTKQKNNHKNEDIRANKMQVLKDRGIEILSDYDGRHGLMKVKVRNTSCNHEFEVLANNLIQAGVICPICNNEAKAARLQESHQEYLTEWNKTATEWQKYRAEVNTITRRTYRNHEHTINPRNLTFGVAGKEGAYQLDHIVSVRYCFENSIPAEVCGHPQNLRVISWEQNLAKKHKLLADLIPPLFHQYIASKYVEQSFVEEIQRSVDIKCDIYSDVLHPYHVSLYFPEFSAVVIFCAFGEFTEQKTSTRYQLLDIVDKAVELKLRSIVVFEDEWYKNKTMVINKIRHICKQNTKAVRIHGRSCIISEIDSKTKSAFMRVNHIQGNDKASISIGAFYDKQLVAVMTFAQPKIHMGTNNTERHEHEWELSRFATDMQFNIPGIASKLLSYFTKQYQWDKIFSFADLRWSNGNLYSKLGFKLDIVNPPDYYYIIEGVRAHRWSFRKDVLKDILEHFDATLTEYQNMVNHGYDRIWNVGLMKFSLLAN